MTILEELAKLLNRGSYDGTMFTLEARNAFEPHGRASETWEVDYIVTLPDVWQHWRDNKGRWIPTKNFGPATFHGRTPDVALGLAIKFLQESGAKQRLVSPQQPTAEDPTR